MTEPGLGSGALREALAGLFELVESGELVRDVSRDGQSDWHMRMLKMTLTLKKAQEALSLSSPIEPGPTKRKLKPGPYKKWCAEHGQAPPCTVCDYEDVVLAQASSEIREALEQVATYIETLSIEHSPDCSYGATHGPHGDFCDCGLKARRGKRLEVYAVIQAALAPSRQGAGGK